MSQEQDITARLEGWRVVDAVDREGNQCRVAYGFIYDDKKDRFFDEDWIRTSIIVEDNLNPKMYQKGDVIETLNSKYLLGEPING